MVVANGWLGGGDCVNGLKATGRQWRNGAVTSSSLMAAMAGAVSRCWSLYTFELKTSECKVMLSVMPLISLDALSLSMSCAVTVCNRTNRGLVNVSHLAKRLCRCGDLFSQCMFFYFIPLCVFRILLTILTTKASGPISEGSNILNQLHSIWKLDDFPCIIRK